MSTLELQAIYIYPIKSLGGISVQEAAVQQQGLQYDRRWMLVDERGMFMTQRKFNTLALLQVTLTDEGLKVTHKNNELTPLIIPFNASRKREITVSIWDDICTATEVSAAANEWFSDALDKQVQLVYMPENTRRLVDPDYTNNEEVVSFADAYPFMMIGQSSLDDLNGRLQSPLLMNRFRPNLVFKGGAPFCEDTMQAFSVGAVTFYAVKPCSRCVLITINQETGTKEPEPLKTLATYRVLNNKVMFGQNLLHTGSGVIKVGDKLVVHRWK